MASSEGGAFCRGLQGFVRRICCFQRSDCCHEASSPPAQRSNLGARLRAGGDRHDHVCATACRADGQTSERPYGGRSSPSSARASKGPSPGDTLLERCLRAEGGEMQRALRRVEEIQAWRQREGIDALLRDQAALADELTWRPLLKYELPGLDKKRRPVMIESIGQWDMAALERAIQDRRESLVRSHIMVCEMLMQQAAKGRSTKLTRSDVSPTAADDGEDPSLPRWVVIFDMQGLAFHHAKYPGVLSCLKQVSALDEQYYPETIDHIFVVNTPRAFWFLWRIVSRFINADTKAKVMVLRKGCLGPLLAECGSACIPARLGGSYVAPAEAECRPSSDAAHQTLSKLSVAPVVRCDFESAWRQDAGSAAVSWSCWLLLSCLLVALLWLLSVVARDMTYVVYLVPL
eukprot:TRINITY_DN49192_c0_g1_i1.p1 TRINITY_DN49192_c0_g1~~TRINITY_DN49192_c0_g1_i1.p1  ORF type:complete len:404 (+),score=52.81 TRINITY_DN49192_c0_g1_i1:81-1292(+)